MKITKKYLQKVIKEETEKVLKESIMSGVGSGVTIGSTTAPENSEIEMLVNMFNKQADQLKAAHTSNCEMNRASPLQGAYASDKPVTLTFKVGEITLAQNEWRSQLANKKLNRLDPGEMPPFSRHAYTSDASERKLQLRWRRKKDEYEAEKQRKENLIRKFSEKTRKRAEQRLEFINHILGIPSIGARLGIQQKIYKSSLKNEREIYYATGTITAPVCQIADLFYKMAVCIRNGKADHGAKGASACLNN
jgi:hypothetical protein